MDIIIIMPVKTIKQAYLMFFKECPQNTFFPSLRYIFDLKLFKRRRTMGKWQK